MEALSIVECDSNWIEWEEVECGSSDDSTDVESEACDENTGLGIYKAPLIIQQQETLLSSPRIDHSIEVDPVMVEVLSSTLAMIERRQIIELQELIAACLHLRDDDVSGSRSSILQRAVHVRNQLNEIKNRILKLGIEVKERSRPTRHPSEPLTGPSQSRVNTQFYSAFVKSFALQNSKRKRGVDPTQAKLETPYVLAASPEEILFRSKETKSTQILDSETPAVEIRRQLSPELAQSLLRQAPRLNEIQTKTQLQKNRWRFGRRPKIEVSCQKKSDLETPLPEPSMSVREADRLYNERIISGAGSTEVAVENNADFETRANRRKKQNPKIAKIKRWLFEK